MSRKLAVLMALTAIAVGLFAYQYFQHREAQLVAQAREETARALMMKMKGLQEKGKLTPQREDELASEAKALIDAWDGQGDGLLKARGNLQVALKSNPKHVRARIEMARFHLVSGYISYSNVRPESLEQALKELELAILVDPKSADAYVLRGHVMNLNREPQKALKDLDKAEELVTDNPWLHLNRADALMSLRRWGAAEAELRKAEARNDPSLTTRVRSALHGKLSSVLSRQGNLPEADREFLTVIMLEPGSAWNHGNYAAFLLFRRGLPDAAIDEAQRALSIMNYGMGKLTLAAAFYAKSAGLSPRESRKAAEYFSAARELAPDFTWIMPQAASSVDAGQSIQAMVKSLMARGVSINTKDENGDTGLTLAAASGNVRSVSILAKYGANLEAADNDGRTAIAIAAYKGEVETVKTLAKHGARVNVQDHEGRTPIDFAVAGGDAEMIRVLVSLKANVNTATRQGYTPLMHAAIAGDLKIVQLLVEAGAKTDTAIHQPPQTAADIAASQGKDEIARYLREASERRAPPGPRVHRRHCEEENRASA